MNNQINQNQRFLEEFIFFGIAFIFSLIEAGIHTDLSSVICLILSFISLVCVAYLFFDYRGNLKSNVFSKVSQKTKNIIDIVGCVFCMLSYTTLRLCNYEDAPAIFKALVGFMSFIGTIFVFYLTILPTIRLMRERTNRNSSDYQKEIYQQSFDDQYNKRTSTVKKENEIDKDKIIEVEVIDKE